MGTRIRKGRARRKVSAGSPWTRTRTAEVLETRSPRRDTRAVAGTGRAQTERSLGTWALLWTPVRGKDQGTGVRTQTQTGTSRGRGGRIGRRRRRVQSRTGFRRRRGSRGRRRRRKRVRRRRRKRGREIGAKKRKKRRLKKRNRNERGKGTSIMTTLDQRKEGMRRREGMSTGIQTEEKSEGEFGYGD